MRRDCKRVVRCLTPMCRGMRIQMDCIDHWEKKGDGQVPMRSTSKPWTFQNQERGLFSLPRPSWSEPISPARNRYILEQSPNFFLPRAPFTSYRTPPFFSVFYSLFFHHADGRQRQSWPLAIASPDDALPHRIPHLPNRQCTSSRHTCWPRRRRHRCCQWDRSCCRTRVG